MIKTSEKLKAIRSEMQLTQKQLARMLYISRGYLSILEMGVKEPSQRVLKRIEKLYKSIPMVQVMTPSKVKKTWFDTLLDFLLGRRG